MTELERAQFSLRLLTVYQETTGATTGRGMARWVARGARCDESTVNRWLRGGPTKRAWASLEVLELRLLRIRVARAQSILTSAASALEESAGVLRKLASQLVDAADVTQLSLLDGDTHGKE